MPWDNSVNKNAVIYAARTTLGVRNMPLTQLSQSIWIDYIASANRVTFCLHAYMEQHGFLYHSNDACIQKRYVQ